MPISEYRPESYSKGEVKMVKKFILQRDDAKNYFVALTRPRLDRAYKIYIFDNTDRKKQIQSWQANVFVPYAHAVVETLKPRILDARPDFGVQGRNQDDQAKAVKVQQTVDYDWEIAGADATSEMVVDASLIYGTGYMQASWKKDVRTHEFLQSTDISEKKMAWKKKEQTFYDAPFVEHVDNYDLWYDWHNIAEKDKQFWFRRKVLTKETIKRRYPAYDKKRLDQACAKKSGDLTDYASIRNEVKLAHDEISKGADYRKAVTGVTGNTYMETTSDPELRMHECFEWWRPFEDKYAVMVNDVPILKGAEIPNPYDFKEAPFIGIPYLKLPNEYEGYGIPLILENPSIMLNMIKNQRLDAVTLNIHKMWIVNPLANINKEELVTRPFGIIYSTDPNGVKAVEFGDVKTSSYKEEELLKGDMRYGVGVDDFSMGVSGGASSATETRHLRESTLERVRLFVNHLGAGYAELLRYWISMRRQFFTKSFYVRVLGDSGAVEYPLIEKDDLKGEYDYKATVIPSIAGQNDIKKKQDMDLFQLLLNFVDPNAAPFIDGKKLTSKTLYDWNWDIESISVSEQPEGMPLPEPGMGPEAGAGALPRLSGGQIPEDVAKGALDMLGAPAGPSQFAQAGAPINLLKAGAPPTAKGLPLPTTNPRGMNRGGKVNTNVAQKPGNGPGAQLQNRALNLQR